MWDNEDNNPYGSASDRRDTSLPSPTFPTGSANAHGDADWESVGPGFDDGSDGLSPDLETAGRDHPSLLYHQSLGGADLGGSGGGGGDEDEPEAADRPRRKPGGYDSRIEQTLYENPNLPILITDAGKSLEGNGRYTVYTIRTGDLEVRRRYSEFSTLRDALIKLHPTLIIPPIPEKHTMADYAANPTNAKQDQQTIDLRKRMLAVFLNRCRRMVQVRTDGVWWRFLDPNASWSEVMSSPPVSLIPRVILKAPPLDTAHPSPGHSYLPVPAGNAKLKAVAGTHLHINSAAIANQGIARFPPDSHGLTEQELDPYFISYEASVKDLDGLLSTSMEKVNRRMLNHLSSLSADFCELGSKYNALAISEQDPSLMAGIERVGQAADGTYLCTQELSSVLGASFAEPMRENAQFAGVVKGVLRYRVQKRVQQEMTIDELNKKRAHLEQLERSEAEARRLDHYLSSSQLLPPPAGAAAAAATSRKSSSGRDSRDGGGGGGTSAGSGDGNQDDAASIDSDFPPTHGDMPSASMAGVPETTTTRTQSLPLHKKIPSAGNSLTNKIFGPLRHAVQGVVDADPEKSRRDMIGKTMESIEHLEQAKVVSERDVQDASESILADLKRFQREKEDDLRRYMLAFAKSQVEWARRCKETWEEARVEVGKIDET